jgi:tetratricopeptide (TPR) repeat protein
VQSAEELKAKGNAAFSAKNFEEAIEHFTNAIELDSSNHVFYSNRSASYASLGRFNQALADANKVLQLNPTWSKVSELLICLKFCTMMNLWSLRGGGGFDSFLVAGIFTQRSSVARTESTGGGNRSLQGGAKLGPRK